MKLIKTPFDANIPLLLIEAFIIKTFKNWTSGCFSVVKITFSDNEEKVFIDYPTDLNKSDVDTLMIIWMDKIQAFNEETKQHHAVKSDTLVNSGALKLALNALHRSGKYEIANELEITAKRT